MTQVTEDIESVNGSADTESAHAASREALGQAMLRLQGDPSATRESTRESENAETSVATPDQEHAANPALNSDDDTDDEPSSRRGKSSIRELRETVEMLTQRIADMQTKPAESEASGDEDPVAKAEAVIADLRGTDEDWADLQARVVDGLSFDDAERYRRMQVARSFDKDWSAVSDARAGKNFRKYQAEWFEGTLLPAYKAVSEKPGVDESIVMGAPDLGKVFDHIYEAGRNALADENERLKGELKEALIRAAGNRPRLAMGGRSSLSSSGVALSPDASPTDKIREGLRQREQQRRRSA